MASYSTADLIRRAEEDITSGKHLLALGLLAEAARREPGNAYIGVLVLKADKGIERVCTPEPANDGSASERRARLAAMALHGEFGDGTGLLLPGSHNPALDGRVKLLTMVAANLFERGSFEEAIQSLMKAHMLDPKSQHVEACERLLQPALEGMRKRPESAARVRPSTPEEDESGRWDISEFLQKKERPESHPAGVMTAEIKPQHSAAETHRLEALRARQDLERRKREIMRWRQASGPPSQHAGKRVKEAGKQIPPAQPHHTPQLSAFFSKLKQGKLFG
jgi:hypothetical protein